MKKHLGWLLVVVLFVAHWGRQTPKRITAPVPASPSSPQFVLPEQTLDQPWKLDGVTLGMSRNEIHGQQLLEYSPEQKVVAIRGLRLYRGDQLMLRGTESASRVRKNLVSQDPNPGGFYWNYEGNLRIAFIDDDGKLGGQATIAEMMLLDRGYYD